MSIIKEKILYSSLPAPKLFPPELKGNLGEAILDTINNDLEKFGDMDWLINGPYEIENDTHTCGQKKMRLSQAKGIYLEIEFNG